MANDERFIIEETTNDFMLEGDEPRPLLFTSDSFFDGLNEFRRLGFLHPDREFLFSVGNATRIRTLESSERDNVIRVARGKGPILT